MHGSGRCGCHKASSFRLAFEKCIHLLVQRSNFGFCLRYSIIFASLLFHHPLLSDPFGPVIGGPNMGHTHVSASRLEGPLHRSCGTPVFYETGLL